MALVRTGRQRPRYTDLRGGPPHSSTLGSQEHDMKNHAAIFIFLATVIIASVCDAGVRKVIRFSPGSVSSTVEEAVIRGERDVYFVTARAGQTLEVSISALEDNAVFSIYQPGSVAVEKVGVTKVTGNTLPKAGETDDATVWKGALPVSGKYLIVVGGTRGNATYKLRVTIR
jgi:hypothetical protein